MSEQNKNDEVIHFPQKLKTEKEIIKGLGSKELIKVIVTILIFSIPVFFYYGITDKLGTTITAEAILIMVTYFLFAKIDEGNVSLIDYIRFTLDFLKIQKHYKYKYIEEWDLEE